MPVEKMRFEDLNPPACPPKPAPAPAPKAKAPSKLATPKTTITE